MVYDSVCCSMTEMKYAIVSEGWVGCAVLTGPQAQ